MLWVCSPPQLPKPMKISSRWRRPRSPGSGPGGRRPERRRRPRSSSCPPTIGPPNSAEIAENEPRWRERFAPAGRTGMSAPASRRRAERDERRLRARARRRRRASRAPRARSPVHGGHRRGPPPMPSSGGWPPSPGEQLPREEDDARAGGRQQDARGTRAGPSGRVRSAGCPTASARGRDTQEERGENAAGIRSRLEPTSEVGLARDEGCWTASGTLGVALGCCEAQQLSEQKKYGVWCGSGGRRRCGSTHPADGVDRKVCGAGDRERREISTGSETLRSAWRRATRRTRLPGLARAQPCGR